MDVDCSSTNLIINYLPQNLSDEEFRCMFLSIGPVKSCKIIRDRSSGYSYGFGFVDYQRDVDANRAIETLNGLQMGNKRIKVAFARQGGDKIKGSNLYVRNIPVDWSEEDLGNYFGAYGAIIQTRILNDQFTGVSKGVGFVLFSAKAEADSACHDLHGKAPAGYAEVLQVKFADDNAKKLRPPPPTQNYHGYEDHSSGYMGGSGYGRHQTQGPIRNQRNRHNYNPMGQNQYQGRGGQGQGQGIQHEVPGHILFVYNIGTDADEKLLWQWFAPCGTVQKVNIIMDSAKGCCKGYGFVTMTNYEEAEYAIQCYNGYWHNGKQLQVSFKK